MSMQDVKKNEASLVSHILPLLRTATVTPAAGVDLKGSFGAEVIMDVGTVTDGTFTMEVQESDASGSGFTAVAAADLEGSEAAFSSANEEQVHQVWYKGSKRYIRVVLTASGSPSTGGTIGCIIRKAPLRNQGSKLG